MLTEEDKNDEEDIDINFKIKVDALLKVDP